MKHSISLKYPLKVWLFTIIGAPLLLLIIVDTSNSKTFGELSASSSLILPFLLFGGLLSLPALFVYCRIYVIVIELQTHPVFQKVLMLFCNIFLISATFHISEEFDNYPMGMTLYSLPNCYYVSAVLFTFAFEIKSKETRRMEIAEK